MTLSGGADKVGRSIMDRRRLGARLLAAGLSLAVLGCGDDLDTSFPRPTDALTITLYDLVTGPIDRQSALNMVSGRGLGIPRPVRVDESDQWDIAFATLDGEPVWLPRGYFQSLEVEAGIMALDRGFEEVERVPEDRTLYENMDPVPAEVGRVYAIRSRTDPGLSFPCHVYAKLVIDAIEGDPPRMRIRTLWNPNCDDQNVTPREQG